MAAARHGAPAPGPPPAAPRESDVLLDVELVDGLLFLALVNVGELPAHRVRVRFGAPVRGLGGERRVDRLALFRRLEFLGPGRELRTLLDRAALFFARDEPTRLEAVVSWRTDGGEPRTREIRHDLEVFRDLAHVEQEVPHRGRQP